MDKEKEITEKLQKAQLKIFSEFDRVCKCLGLTYCLAFGTALGAVRHKGFIPWDDDIDVYMRIEDLETLQKNSEMFLGEYFLQYVGSDLQYRLMITRLRDSNTTLIESTESDRDINHGIFIDIYPLFNIQMNGWSAQKSVFASMLYRLLLYKQPPKNRGLLMQIGSYVLLEVIPRKIQNFLLDYSYNLMRNVPFTGYVSSLYGDEANIKYRYDDFFPVINCSFENLSVPVPGNYDSYLTLTYGNYMELPPENKRTVHHDYLLIDFEHPYTVYRGMVYCKQ